MRVALLTTGQTEMNGLPRALAALFPGHEFTAIEDVPGRPFRGFTSGRLPQPPEAMRLPTQLDTIVSRVLGLMERTNEVWDHICVVDDLELCNRDQPGVVVEAVREVFARHLSRLLANPPRVAALARGLRERVSLHLVKPMIEAWFFGAPRVFQCQGMAFQARFHIQGHDPEAFESTDRAYIAATEDACVTWCRRRRQRGDRPKWIGAERNRIHHPKGYLQWLMIDGAAPTCTRYVEADAGGRALAELDWATLLGHPHRAPFARALVEDLADRLGQAPAVSVWQGVSAPETSIRVLPWWPVLRNI